MASPTLMCTTALPAWSNHHPRRFLHCRIPFVKQEIKLHSSDQYKLYVHKRKTLEKASPGSQKDLKFMHKDVFPIWNSHALHSLSKDGLIERTVI